MQHIYVVIATSFNRTDLLLNRSLLSIYKQKNIDKEKVKILIIDDNKTSEIENINNGLKKLRHKLRLSTNDFKTIVIPNNRIKGQSGTGAWNTGIFFIKQFKNWRESFIAILDDDDEYLHNYLKTCLSNILDKKHSKTVAVFCQLIWKSEHNDIIHRLTQNNLNQENFFIGNPGVQGSNTFINAEIFNLIYGFDETFPNSNDREMMIRLLDFVEKHNKNHRKKYICKVVEKPLVIHYNHTGKKVNNNFLSKKQALDLFYAKYKNRFSQDSFLKSLERANNFFGYKYEE
jgi:hypothetical protein